MITTCKSARALEMAVKEAAKASPLDPDGNDHSIDAVRYAMLDDVLRG